MGKRVNRKRKANERSALVESKRAKPDDADAETEAAEAESRGSAEASLVLEAAVAPNPAAQRKAPALKPVPSVLQSKSKAVVPRTVDNRLPRAPDPTAATASAGSVLPPVVAASAGKSSKLAPTVVAADQATEKDRQPEVAGNMGWWRPLVVGAVLVLLLLSSRFWLGVSGAKRGGAVPPATTKASAKSASPAEAAAHLHTQSAHEREETRLKKEQEDARRVKHLEEEKERERKRHASEKAEAEDKLEKERVRAAEEAEKKKEKEKERVRAAEEAEKKKEKEKERVRAVEEAEKKREKERLDRLEKEKAALAAKEALAKETARLKALEEHAHAHVAPVASIERSSKPSPASTKLTQGVRITFAEPSLSLFSSAHPTFDELVRKDLAGKWTGSHVLSANAGRARDMQLTSPPLVETKGILSAWRTWIDDTVSAGASVVNDRFNIARPPNRTSCYCFGGTNGSISIRLWASVDVHKVALFHLPDEASSAPQDFHLLGWPQNPTRKVWGSRTKKPKLLGDYAALPARVETGKKHAAWDLQSFEIAAVKRRKEGFRTLTLQVLSNFGDLNKTCIYRIQVFGDVVTSTELVKK